MDPVQDPTTTDRQLFIEVASAVTVNGVTTFKRGIVVEWGQYDLLADSTPGTEWFRSFFAFDEQGAEYVRRTGSIKDIPTRLYGPVLTLDLDKPDKALALDLARRVEALYGTRDVEVWFSGTGYHIEFPSPFIVGESIVKAVGERLRKDFPECDPIYDYARLIRLPYTWNRKSGLYKTLWSDRGILPSDPRTNTGHGVQVELTKRTTVIPSPSIPLTASQPLTVSRLPKSVTTEVSTVVTCMQKAYNAGPISGTRHKTVLRLVSAWRRQGLPREACMKLIEDWIADSKFESTRLVDQVFDRPYVFGCHDEIMVQWCDPSCIFFKNKNLGLDITHPDDLEKELEQYITNSLTARSLRLDKIYSMPGEYGMYPGEFIAILGDTGVGKTTFIQNLCMNAGHLKILFLSLEVHKPMLFRRFLQMSNTWTKEEVYEYFQKTAQRNGVSNGIGHIRISGGHTDLRGLERMIATSQADLVVIDTIDGLTVASARDSLDKSEQLGIELKELAQKTNTIIVGIHHISKAAAFAASEHNDHLTVHSGKGSSAIEQKADKVLSVEGNRDQAYRRIRSLKARDESRMELHMIFDPVYFLFKQSYTHGVIQPLIIGGICDGEHPDRPRDGGLFDNTSDGV